MPDCCYCGPGAALPQTPIKLSIFSACINYSFILWPGPMFVGMLRGVDAKIRQVDLTCGLIQVFESGVQQFSWGSYDRVSPYCGWVIWLSINPALPGYEFWTVEYIFGLQRVLLHITHVETLRSLRCTTR